MLVGSSATHAPPMPSQGHCGSLGKRAWTWPPPCPSPGACMQWRMAGSLAAGSLATRGALRLMPSLGMPKPLVAQLSEAATGAIFALGLGLSGMLQPAKVAG